MKEFKNIVLFLAGAGFVLGWQLLIYLFSLHSMWALLIFPLMVCMVGSTIYIIMYFAFFLEKLWNTKN